MQTLRIFWIIATTVLVALISPVIGRRIQAGQAYVVSEQLNGNIWRIEDVNGDGDALDDGERTLWGDNFIQPHGMGSDGVAVYVTEQGLADGSNQVVRLADVNGDGDALDIGERTVWLDGLDDPRDVARGPNGAWYLSEFDDDQVWRLVDANGDGDALDIGEKTLFGVSVDGPQTILSQGGALMVASEPGDQVHRLVDLNGDGDALDIGENLPITPEFDQVRSIIDDGGGGFFFTSFSSDIVYRASDLNGDGDVLDVAEVLRYADPVFGQIDGPWGMAPYEGAGFLLADFNNAQVKLARDVNADGDALDVGEVVLFADGIDAPVDIVSLPVGLVGDFDQDDDVDGFDFLEWQRGKSPNPLSQSDLADWEAYFGTAASLLANSTQVPELSSGSMLLLGLAVMMLTGCRTTVSKLNR